jgi:hypothetical protein
MDGEWVNPVAADPEVSDVFPSGDNVPGGDFSFRFSVLPGDVSSSANSAAAEVGAEDFRAVLDRQFLNALNATYQAIADLDGNGAINVLDLARLRDRIGESLPVAESLSNAAVPAGVGANLNYRSPAAHFHATRRRIARISEPNAALAGYPLAPTQQSLLALKRIGERHDRDAGTAP